MGRWLTAASLPPGSRNGAWAANVRRRPAPQLPAPALLPTPAGSATAACALALTAAAESARLLTGTAVAPTGPRALMIRSGASSSVATVGCVVPVRVSATAITHVAVRGGCRLVRPTAAAIASAATAKTTAAVRTATTMRVTASMRTAATMRSATTTGVVPTTATVT